MGSEDNRQLPSCQCRIYQRSHLPCKYHCGVSNHVLEWNFMRLPKFYINNLLLVLDVACVPGLPIPQEKLNVSEHVFSWPDSSTYLVDKSDSPKANEQCHLKVAAQRCREALLKLQNFTYLVQSPSALKIVTTQLEDIVKSLDESCHTSSGILILLEYPVQKQKPGRKLVNLVQEV